MVKITSDEHFFKVVHDEIKESKRVTKARSRLLESISSRYEKSDSPFNPKYLILIIESMNQQIGVITLLTLAVSQAVLKMTVTTVNRNENIELLNSIVADLNDQKMEVKEFLELVKRYFKDSELSR